MKVRHFGEVMVGHKSADLKDIVLEKCPLVKGKSGVEKISEEEFCAPVRKMSQFTVQQTL